ncbi:MAG: hypothetical protein HRU30_19320 [Rhodobacteraceae bacterium]|nr:hypothetical protein [Paracoccaceae bacterium]
MAPPSDPPNLRFLRILVTVLTGTMIVGVLTIVVLLVIRLQTPAGPSAPEILNLPDGTEVHALTQGPDFWAVVTKAGRILIFNPDGTLRQEITVE